jgi:hypothetical protein
MVLINHRVDQSTYAGDDGENQNKESDVRRNFHLFLSNYGLKHNIQLYFMKMLTQANFVVLNDID